MPKHPFLGLVALGPVDPYILRSLRTALSKFLMLPVRILRPKPLPLKTYHAVRQQYNAIQLLEFILDNVETGAFRVLGVTTQDLYIPILTFVFGDGQLNGKAAIISLFRPRGDAGDPMPSRTVFFRRILKLSLHELGHSFGLGHCREEGCLMGFSTNLEKLDQKDIVLCDYCQILLSDYYREQGLLPPPKGYAENHAADNSILAASNPRKH
jgi:archaemetzincin